MATDPSVHSALDFIRPTKRTLFLRKFFLWQLVRFLVVNLRMTRMILMSHDSTPRLRPPPG